VIALLVLGLLSELAQGSLTGVIFVAVILWGILSFVWWPYLLVMFCAGVGLILGAAITVAGILAGSFKLYAAILLGLNAFVLAVLYSRPHHFD
jgi:hypothetical protein